MQKYNLKPEFIIQITSFFWIITKFVSFNLWFSFYRTVPELRNFELINPNISTITTNILSGFSILLLAFLLIKFKRSIVFLIVILEIILASFDQMRWQPFVFQFVVTFLMYVLHPKKFYFHLLLLLSATYFYSGIHKLNYGFVQQIWVQKILNDFLYLPMSITSNFMVEKLGFLIGFIELLLGILILFNRKYFVEIVIVHLFILAFIGPFGLCFNEVVWGWNLLMILYALLYYFTTEINFCKATNFKSSLTQIWVVILFILPLLSFAKLYNPYFSFELYSGKTTKVYMITKNKKYEEFKIINPSKYYLNCLKDEFIFNLNTYTYDNLKVSVPPHEPIFMNLINQMTHTAEETDNIQFYIVPYPFTERSIILINY